MDGLDVGRAELLSWAGLLGKFWVHQLAEAQPQGGFGPRATLLAQAPWAFLGSTSPLDIKNK